MNAAIDSRAFRRRLWQLTLPIAFQSLMLAAVAAGDALMLGRVAQQEMTAVSLATQIQFVQNMFVSAITAAGSILGAQYFGKGDRHTMEELFSLILRFSGLVSLLFFSACELAPEALMRIFTHDPALLEIGKNYLRIAGWSYLITGISQCYLAMLKVSDHVPASAWISSAAVILNILLNAVFIFGLLGAPRMESRGAALATTLSRVIELALCLAVSAGHDHIHPDWKRFLRGRRQLALDFRRQCLPLMGGCLFWGVGFTSYTAIIGHMGADAAAANSVAAVVRDLICCACNGVGTAAGIMVGNEQAGNRQSLRHPAEKYLLDHRLRLHRPRSGAGPLHCPHGDSDAGSAEQPHRHDDHHGRLYDRPLRQHGHHQRGAGRRRGHAFRYVQPGCHDVGTCNSAGTAGRLRVSLARAGGVCLHLSG